MVFVAKWFDNKRIHLASIFSGVTDVGTKGEFDIDFIWVSISFYVIRGIGTPKSALPKCWTKFLMMRCTRHVSRVVKKLSKNENIV